MSVTGTYRKGGSQEVSSFITIIIISKTKEDGARKKKGGRATWHGIHSPSSMTEGKKEREIEEKYFLAMSISSIVPASERSFSITHCVWQSDPCREPEKKKKEMSLAETEKSPVCLTDLNFFEVRRSF